MKTSRGVWETLDSLCRALEETAPARLVDRGLEHLGKLSASERCSLYLRRGKRALTLAGWRGVRNLPERISCASDTPDDSLMLRVLETREPLFIRDIERFRRQAGLRRPPYDRANPRSREYDPACVVVPVPGPAAGEPFGILNLSDIRGGPPRRGSSRRGALLHGAALLGMALRTAHRHCELEARASRDGLTGLYNYATFYDLLGSEVLRAERYRTPLSLILLDIDNFKTFNDTHGHAGPHRLKHDAGGSALRIDDRVVAVCAERSAGGLDAVGVDRAAGVGGHGQ